MPTLTSTHTPAVVVIPTDLAPPLDRATNMANFGTVLTHDQLLDRLYATVERIPEDALTTADVIAMLGIYTSIHNRIDDQRGAPVLTLIQGGQR